MIIEFLSQCFATLLGVFVGFELELYRDRNRKGREENERKIRTLESIKKELELT
ncbi:MAG: hypothetical protein ACTSR0_00600 [Candidatus Asgardarchaeia archaeon]